MELSKLEWAIQVHQFVDKTVAELSARQRHSAPSNPRPRAAGRGRSKICRGPKAAARWHLRFAKIKKKNQNEKWPNKKPGSPWSNRAQPTWHRRPPWGQQGANCGHRCTPRSCSLTRADWRCWRKSAPRPTGRRRWPRLSSATGRRCGAAAATCAFTRWCATARNPRCHSRPRFRGGRLQREASKRRTRPDYLIPAGACPRPRSGARGMTSVDMIRTSETLN